MINSSYRAKRLWVATILFWIGFSIGCGDNGPQLVEMSGTATYDGKPISGLELKFYPIEGGRSSSAFTNTQGKFMVAFRSGVKGLLPGEHRVQAIYLGPHEQLEGDGYIVRKLPAPYDAIIKKYGDAEKTPLVIVAVEDQNDVVITLD